MEGVEREEEGSMTTVEKVQCMCGGRGGGAERVEAKVEREEMSRRKERGESEAEENFEEQVKRGRE